MHLGPLHREISMPTSNAETLHRESIIIDGLNASYFFSEKVLHRMQAGGITAANATIAAWHGLAETMKLIGEYLYLFRQQAQLIMPVRSVDDIETAKKTGRVGLIFGFQDVAPLEDDLRLLAVYHALGVRIIQLTYNHVNAAGCGCMVDEDTGLTDFGQKVVAEMNRLGILIDLSHCGARTGREAIEASQQPAAFTHTDPSALSRHPRNKDDELLRALARKGGVIGAAMLPAMLPGRERTTIEDYLAAIDYLVNLVGVDHVGIGPDFMEDMPEEILAPALRGISEADKRKFFDSMVLEGFESISACPRVTAGLLERGYSTDDIKKIMGGNWMRLYRQVWR